MKSLNIKIIGIVCLLVVFFTLHADVYPVRYEVFNGARIVRGVAQDIPYRAPWKWRRLAQGLRQQGLSENEIRFIIEESAISPREYRYVHEYELGITKIKDLVKSLEGPTILVIEGAMANGKTYLANRLRTGSDLGIDASNISVFHEDDYGGDWWDVDIVGRLVPVFIGRLVDAEQKGVKLVIYDGHEFDRFYEAAMHKLTAEEIKERLKTYNIVKVKVRLVVNRDGLFLAKDGSLVPPINWRDMDSPESIAIQESSRRYIIVTPNSIIQRAR